MLLFKYSVYMEFGLLSRFLIFCVLFQMELRCAEFVTLYFPQQREREIISFLRPDCQILGLDLEAIKAFKKDQKGVFSDKLIQCTKESGAIKYYDLSINKKCVSIGKIGYVSATNRWFIEIDLKEKKRVAQKLDQHYFVLKSINFEIPGKMLFIFDYTAYCKPKEVINQLVCCVDFASADLETSYCYCFNKNELTQPRPKDSVVPFPQVVS